MAHEVEPPRRRSRLLARWLICTVEKYKGKVKVNFAKGSSVKDPDHLFNASLEAPVGRSIDLREDDELDADAFTALICEAVKVNRK